MCSSPLQYDTSLWNLSFACACAKGIPKWVLQELGDKFQMVLSLTGPSRKSRPVTLRVRDAETTRPRVYLCHGWIAFAKENGFQMGDEIIFWLVSRSSLNHVLAVSTGSTQLIRQKATFTAQITRSSKDMWQILEQVTMPWSQLELSQPRHPKATTNCNEDIIQIRTPYQVNSNPAEACVPTLYWTQLGTQACK